MQAQHAQGFSWQSIAFFIAPMLVTGVLFWPSTTHSWVNWDDYAYVVNNPFVRDLSWAKMLALIDNQTIIGTYLPLTVLSWATDHALFGGLPGAFHRTNVLLHVCNVGLVYALVRAITGRVEAAALAAVLFGIHPMHVESVAWISARKDLLYTAFYLAGMLSWWRFIHTQSRKWLWFVAAGLFCLLSLLSKGQALTFPLALLALDFVAKRKLSVQLLLEKLPFAALCGFFAWLAVLGQQEVGAMTSVASIPLYKTVFVAAFGFVNYVTKVLVPLNITAFHPMPDVSNGLPWWCYAAAVPALLVAGLAWYWRNSKPIFTFALAFCALALIPVLQLIPVGMAITADRYSYLAYFGPFCALGWLFVQALNRSQMWRWSALVAVAVLLLGFSSLTRQRLQVWQNGETLWTDVIAHYPDHELAYINRAEVHRLSGAHDKALADLNAAVELAPGKAAPLIDRAKVYEAQNQPQRALADLEQAVLLEPNNARAHLNRGLLLHTSGASREGLTAINTALELNEHYYLGYLNRGVVHESLGEAEQAMHDYSRAAELNPLEPDPLIYRGVLLTRKQKFAEGLADFDRALLIDPSHIRALKWRSETLKNMGRFAEALAAAERAQAAGAKLDQAYFDYLKNKLNKSH